MRVRWGTFNSVPTILGILANIVGWQGAYSRTIWGYWQGTRGAGKAPIVKKVLDRSIKESDWKSDVEWPIGGFK